MRSEINKSRTSRFGLLAFALAVGCAVSATAFAAVTIYENDFKAKREFKSVSKAAGGGACDRNWYKQKAFEIEVKTGKRTECAYEIPVFSDGSGGDLTVKAIAKIFSEGTTSKIRKGAFAFVALRASNSTRYQLRVFPKAGRWELRRSPASSEFPVKGKLGQIAPLDKRNAIQVRVADDEIDAWIQSKPVIKKLVDSDAAEVDGTAIRFGIGQANRGKRPTIGIFNKVRVDLPNP